MIIKAENIAKRYKREWVFKNFHYTFELNQAYAIQGYNGSGKSTLLQILAGIIPPSEGSVSYTSAIEIDEDEIYKEINFVAPYMELIEEFSLQEALEFHVRFKKLRNDLSAEDFFKICYLENDLNKKVGEFSSGMKQRLKLGLALLSQCKVVFLDEPTSNLDEQGRAWYLDQVKQYSEGRAIIVSSNDPFEYSFCNNHIDITNFK